MSIFQNRIAGMCKYLCKIWKYLSRICSFFVKCVDSWTNKYRAITLLFALIIFSIILLFIANLDFVREKKPIWPFTFLENYYQLNSRDLLKAVAFGLTLPVAFLVWHWRDANKRSEIENARKDTNLKEFQEVQLRAAGAIDPNLPVEAREQLQIAALHQLRIFLQTDQPENFRRTAFELLLAGHSAAIHRIGVPKVQDQIKSAVTPFTDKPIEDALFRLREKLSPADNERIKIIAGELEHFSQSGFSLENRRFDLLEFERVGVGTPGPKLPPKLSLRSSSFFGANMYQVDFNGADLSWSYLDGANFKEAKLEGVNLQFLKEGRPLNLCQAAYDEHTKFTDPANREVEWAKLTPCQRKAARAPWIARGMINVNDPPTGPFDG